MGSLKALAVDCLVCSATKAKSRTMQEWRAGLRLTLYVSDDIVHFSTQIGTQHEGSLMARRIAVTAGMGAIIAMGRSPPAEGAKRPRKTTSPPPTTDLPSTTNAPSAPTVAPDGEVDQSHRRANRFTHPVKAPSAPTAIPGEPLTAGMRRSGQDRGRRHRTAVPAVAKDANGRWPVQR